MSLFTTTSTTSALPSMPVERIGRFVLHRAGIRNVWQYDDLQIVFSGGRLLLRGKNGAGKSKAMEMLLPFLLDGDTRNLDCVARDRTKLEWLMTEGRDSGNHIGYMWLELRAVDADGDEQFRTLGCGVKVAPSTRKPTVWFFCTPKRIGAELHVDDEAGMVAQDAFREQLDGDEYFTSSASYARRVAKDLFGIEDDVRYRNLCHLLYELRRPSVGENIEAGQHTKVLTEALPPLDDGLLASVARNFDDLKKIREDLARAEQTSRALNEFLDAYRGYTRGVVRDRAGKLTSAADAASTARRKHRDAVTAEDRARTTKDDAQARVDDLAATVANANAELQVLAASPAYQTLQALNDRRARVDAVRDTAQAAETAAVRATEAETNAAIAATDTAGDAELEASATAAARRELEPLVVGVGLDALLLPATITVRDAVVAASTEVRVRRLEGPVTVERLTPRQLDPEAATSAVETYQTTLAALARIVDDRRVNVTTLLQAGHAVETTRLTAERVSEAEAEAEGRFEAAAGNEAAALTAAREADRAWRRGLTGWVAAARQVAPAVDWAPIADYTATSDDDDVTATDADDVAALVSDLLAAPRGDRADALAAARATQRDAEAVLAELHEQRAEVEARTEKLPAPSRYRAPRDPATGVPFYALVDFRAGIDDATAAGVEAALEASGLLDAWVTPTGVVVDATTRDLVLVAAPLDETTTTLAEVLLPALPPASPVATGTVGAVLASIGLGSDTAATSWVAADGRWRLGVAHGAWSKDTVEFLGVGARRAARDRELAELDRRIDAGITALDTAEGAVRAAEDAARAVEDLDRRLPSPVALRKAVAHVEALASVTATAQAELARKRTAADTARDAAAQAKRDFDDRARRLGLPSNVAEIRKLSSGLDAVVGPLRAARKEPERILRALGKHRAALTAWQAAAATRAELEGAATGQRTQWETEREQLAALEDAHGDDARAAEAKMAALREELKAAELELPEAGAKNLDAAGAHVLAEATVTALASEVRTWDEATEATAATLVRVLATPGLALAAFGSTPPPLAVPDRATGTDDRARVRQLRDYSAAASTAATGGAAVSDSAILNRYAALTGDSGLAAGYEPYQDETADQVKVFGIHDDTGTNPVAVVAERLTGEVADAQGRLTRRQEEVFERHLLGELGDHLRHQLNEADNLVAAMNRSLAGVRTSHGLGVKVDWDLADDVAPERQDAVPLLREASAMRIPERTRRLGELLGALIEGERLKDPTAPYEAHLRAALDYRAWHSFTIRVVEAANPGRVRKLSKQLAVSQGEQRVLAYLSLFSGAAAYFDSLRRRAPKAPRLILLDDAFAKIDEPTHGRLLGLLVELDLDFVITSERVTGCVPGITLEVYECLRDPRMCGVAVVHTHWDGQRAQLQAV